MKYIDWNYNLDKNGISTSFNCNEHFINSFQNKEVGKYIDLICSHRDSKETKDFCDKFIVFYITCLIERYFDKEIDATIDKWSNYFNNSFIKYMEKHSA